MKKKKGNTHEHRGEGDVMRNDPPTNVFRHTLRGKHAISCWSSGIKVISWLWQELHENVLDWLILCKEHRSFYPKARGHYVFLSACPPASIFPLFLSLPVRVYPAYVCLLVCSVFLSVWPSLFVYFFQKTLSQLTLVTLCRVHLPQKLRCPDHLHLLLTAGGFHPVHALSVVLHRPARGRWKHKRWILLRHCRNSYFLIIRS